MRRLVQFDLTRDDIPPLKGHDWTKETPFAANMANEDLKVVRSGTSARFGEALTLAREMMELANPDKLITFGETESDKDGRTKSIIVRAVE